MSGLVDVVTEIAPVISATTVSSEETKATAAIAADAVTIGTVTVPGEDVATIIPSESEKVVSVEEKQEPEQPPEPQQPREELEIVQKANEDDEVIGDVVDQFDKAVTLNPQSTNSLQQIQAVQSHLSAGIDHSYLQLPIAFLFLPECFVSLVCLSFFVHFQESCSRILDSECKQFHPNTSSSYSPFSPFSPDFPICSHYGFQSSFDSGRVDIGHALRQTLGDSSIHHSSHSRWAQCDRTGTGGVRQDDRIYHWDVEHRRPD